MKYLMTACLLATLSVWVNAADDCTMCHDKAPIPPGHMPVTEVTAKNCMMCHAADPEDAFFRKVHTVHTEMGMECSSCHSNVNDEQRSRLDTLLPLP